MISPNDWKKSPVLPWLGALAIAAVPALITEIGSYLRERRKGSKPEPEKKEQNT